VSASVVEGGLWNTDRQLRSVRADVDVPTICVLGDQSVGKSSVIEAISGIKLPRALDTCTRQVSSPGVSRMSVAEGSCPGVLYTADSRNRTSRGNALFP
jgi:GTPase SAR1 family protein